MLWRALGHIPDGFYIDVGANEPTADSVTKLFYDRGWKGVNIEPLPDCIAALQTERPRDVNLRCAAGPHEGSLQLWNCDVRGWATADMQVAAAHRANGFSGEYVQVPMTTLTQICQAHCPTNIHFLKIDVEGFEHEVLQGMDFARFRPWIIVVEAYRPGSGKEQPSYAAWESLLTENRYRFVFGDGLNRFYLSDDHAALAPSLRDPPNVRDGFVRVEVVHGEILVQQAQENAEHWQARAKEYEQRAEAERLNVQYWQSLLSLSKVDLNRIEANLHAAELREASIASQLHLSQGQLSAALALTDKKITEIEAISQKVAELERHLQVIKRSRSWRITEPLRSIVKFFRLHFEHKKLPPVVFNLPMPNSKPQEGSQEEASMQGRALLNREPAVQEFIDRRTRRIFFRLHSAQVHRVEGAN